MLHGTVLAYGTSCAPISSSRRPPAALSLQAAAQSSQASSQALEHPTSRDFVKELSPETSSTRPWPVIIGSLAVHLVPSLIPLQSHHPATRHSKSQFTSIVAEHTPQCLFGCMDNGDSTSPPVSPPTDHPATRSQSSEILPLEHDAPPNLLPAQPVARHGEQPLHYQVTDAPPFWSRTRHSRTSSSLSYHSLNQTRPPAIRLEDHTEEDLAESCWAQSVSVDEYVVVSGPTGIGAYVVWHCTVRTLKGGDLALRKRFSEVDRLRECLVEAFPHAEAMIPDLPRKSVVSRFRPKFLEQRRNGLSHFLNCILLNPEFASSPILKDFVFN